MLVQGNVLSWDIQVGDTVTFRVVTSWSSRRASRKVNHIASDRVSITYGGWRDFILRADEICQVVPGSLRKEDGIPRTQTIEDALTRRKKEAGQHGVAHHIAKRGGQ